MKHEEIETMIPHLLKHWRLLAIGGPIAVAFTIGLPQRVEAQTEEPTVVYACYVPEVGALYRIKQPGLPNTCFEESHIEFSWDKLPVDCTDDQIARWDGSAWVCADPGDLGEATPPVSFFAYLSAIYGPVNLPTVPFDQELIDLGSNHNSGVFVAPVDGVYDLAAHVTITGNIGGAVFLVVAGRHLMSADVLTDSKRVHSITVTVPLSAGESVYVYVAESEVYIHGVMPEANLYQSFFSGHLVHTLSP